jgi:hypothetical protein
LPRSPTQALPQIKRIRARLKAQGILGRKPSRGVRRQSQSRCKNDPRCARFAARAPRILQIDRDAFISSASSHQLCHSNFVTRTWEDLHDFDVFAVRALAFGAHAGRRPRPLRATSPASIGPDVPITKASKIFQISQAVSLIFNDVCDRCCRIAASTNGAGLRAKRSRMMP